MRIDQARTLLARAAGEEHRSVAALASHWGVSHKTVLKLIAAKVLRAHRVGRVWRIAPKEIRRYEQQQERAGN